MRDRLQVLAVVLLLAAAIAAAHFGFRRLTPAPEVGLKLPGLDVPATP